MPGWAWLLVGMVSGLTIGYLWLLWFLKDMWR